MRLQIGLQTQSDAWQSGFQVYVRQVDVSAADALCMQTGPRRRVRLPLMLNDKACSIVCVEWTSLVRQA